MISTSSGSSRRFEWTSPQLFCSALLYTLLRSAPLPSPPLSSTLLYSPQRYSTLFPLLRSTLLYSNPKSLYIRSFSTKLLLSLFITRRRPKQFRDSMGATWQFQAFGKLWTRFWFFIDLWQLPVGGCSMNILWISILHSLFVFWAVSLLMTYDLWLLLLALLVFVCSCVFCIAEFLPCKLHGWFYDKLNGAKS